MKRSRLFKTEIIVLALVMVLWVVNRETDCVPHATAGALRQVVKMAPNSPSAYTLLGRAYHRMNRPQDALAAFGQARHLAVKKSVEMNPDDALAHLALGYDYHFADEANVELAIEEYRAAVRLDPNLADAWLFLGVACEQEGRHNLAMEAFEKAVCLAPDPRACGCLASVCDKVTETHPRRADAYLTLGLAYYKLGALEQAVAAYEKVIALDPDSEQAHFDLGRIYVETGDQDLASREHQLLKELDGELASELRALMNGEPDHSKGIR